MRASSGLALVFAVLLAPWALGCGDDGGSGNDGGDTGDSGDDGAGDGGADGGDDSGDSGDSGDDGGGDGGASFACKHLDVVIAVDPSGSMTQEMTAMADEVFGGANGFARALLDISQGVEDYRVGVLDGCAQTPAFNTTGEPDGDPTVDNGSIDCSFASGKAWIEATPASDPDAVTDEFRCVGRIDRVVNDGNITAGECTGDNDDEQPASAAIAALTGSTNPGFSRDDAVLVVVAITDEDEQPTPVNRSADEIYADLVAAKGGDVKDMVFLGIGGGVPGGCQDPPGMYGTADPASKLYDVTQKFIAQERGVWWDLCEGSLGSGLTEALTVIEKACDEFGGVD